MFEKKNGFLKKWTVDKEENDTGEKKNREQNRKKKSGIKKNSCKNMKKKKRIRTKMAAVKTIFVLRLHFSLQIHFGRWFLLIIFCTPSSFFSFPIFFFFFSTIGSPKSLNF